MRIQTASRIHFGLLSFGGEEMVEGLPARRFGSVGLMVRDPGIEMQIRPATTWSAEGPLAERALAFVKRLVEANPQTGIRPRHLRILRAAPEHAGLGTGTQLGLAVARALTLASGLGHWPVADLAAHVGRGLRSALGVHGFERGGFLVDGGRHSASRLAPLVARIDFPPEWRVVLVVPRIAKGLHGTDEADAFQRLQSGPGMEKVTGSLCRLILLGMLPALAEKDLPAFGEAAFAFNRCVGEAFAAVQGGTYSHPSVTEIVQFIRHQGTRGVAQSSWGPTVFAIEAEADRAEYLAAAVRRRFGLEAGEVMVTRAANEGAVVETS
jgi:beta-RFAP synthase